MNTDKFQDKYNEIFQELKEEKMDWNFDDFLAQTEKPLEAKIVSLKKKPNKQWIYLAASMAVIVGFGIVLKNNFSEKTNIEPTKIVQNTTTENTSIQNITKIESTVKVTDNTMPITRTINTEPVKRKKSKYKNTAQYLAKNHQSTYKNQKKVHIDDEIVEYNPSFVIINGKPVATEDEAIKYTKNAIDMLGGNINTALEKAEPVKLLTVNF